MGRQGVRPSASLRCDEPARSSSPSSSWPVHERARPACRRARIGRHRPRGHRRRARGPGRPDRHGRGHRARPRVRVRVRRRRSALGRDRRLRGRRHRRGLPGRIGRLDAGQGHRRSAHAARARLVGRHALRRVGGPGRRLPRSRRRHVREPHDGPDPARRASARSTASRCHRPGGSSSGVSAPCDACVPASPYAAAVLSFLPDGSDLRVEASGIRAPVGLAYDPATNDLFVTMNQRDDLGDATPATGWRSSGPARTGGSRIATARAGAPATASRRRSPSSTSTPRSAASRSSRAARRRGRVTRRWSRSGPRGRSCGSLSGPVPGPHTGSRRPS